MILGIGLTVVLVFLVVILVRVNLFRRMFLRLMRSARLLLLVRSRVAVAILFVRRLLPKFLGVVLLIFWVLLVLRLVGWVLL